MGAQTATVHLRSSRCGLPSTFTVQRAWYSDTVEARAWAHALHKSRARSEVCAVLMKAPYSLHVAHYKHSAGAAGEGYERRERDVSKRTKDFLKELSELPPERRLREALERLNDTERATREVICLAEQRRAFTKNFSGLDWKKYRPFETLAVTVLFALVIHVCRLWDPPEKKGYSIPTLAAAVDDEGVLALIESQMDSDRRAQDMALLRGALAEVKEIRKLKELERLREHRHKIAHALLKTDQEACTGEPLVESSIPESEVIVGRTVPLMTTVSRLAGERDYDHEAFRQTEREAEDRFFGSLAPIMRKIVPARP
jgi:hypothetical protein